MHTRVKRSAIAVAVAIAATGGFAVPREASAIDFVWKIFNFNMCGYDMGCPAKGGTGVAEAVAQSLKDNPTDVATLNELCFHQAERVRTRLGELGRQWDYVFDPTVHFTNDPDGRPDCLYGNAVMFAGTGYPVAYQYDLYNEGMREPRGLQCVELNAPKPLTDICVTHLINSSSDPKEAATRDRIRQQQSVDILEIVDERQTVFWGNRIPMLGGDFNAVPTNDILDFQYDFSYGADCIGNFLEASGDTRSGPATLDNGNKIDYAFAIWPSYSDGGVVTGPSSWSDHRTVRASFIYTP